MKLTTEQNIHIRETLKAVLSMGESQIVFEKTDGTIRTLRCTRDKDIIPSDLVESTTKSARAESTTSLPVYDTEKEGWRSFTFDKLISVNGMKVEHLLQMIGK